MMTIYSNDPSFDYDIRSLVRAFYPGEEVVFDHDEGKEDAALAILFSDRADDRRCGQEHRQTAEPALEGNAQELVARGITLRRGQDKTRVTVTEPGRVAVKNALKRLLYDALSEATGHELPWGTLTGIRPTKLLLRQLRQGYGYEEAARFMRETYRTSEEKIDLAYGTAKREYALLWESGIPGSEAEKTDPHTPDGYSLYIGIPFCPSICLYCSFSSYPIAAYAVRVTDYLSALKREIDDTAALFADRPLITIYIGGGTPTSLTAEQLDDLLAHIEDRLVLSHLREWTIEAGRPDSLTAEKCRVIRRHGDGRIRISINPQTFSDATLRLIGRHHTAEDVHRAYALARENGIGTINMDLIVGLPGEDATTVERTLAEVRRLAPDNLTVHSLALKRASRLREQWARYGSLSMDNSQTIMDMVHDCAGELGMQPYYLYRQKDIAGNLENVGFAPEGKEGLYNILIMEEVQDIAACGAGAISKRVGRVDALCDDAARPVKTVRAANVKDVALYIDRIDEMIARKRACFAGE